MVKIIMHGCNGKMGQVITDMVKNDDTAEIVAGIDVVDNTTPKATHMLAIISFFIIPPNI